MIRASWYAQLRRVRSNYPSRADRGLPRHPDGSGLVICPRCAGNGCIDSGHWQPELIESAICSLCTGSGYIDDGYRDPLLRMRYARVHRKRDPIAYRHLRQICATPRWQLRLMEAAVGCELAARQVVQSWRDVA